MQAMSLMPLEHDTNRGTRVAVVIPCYRVKKQIMDVLSRIGDECTAIYVVDDCCPEQTGNYVEEHCIDPRVKVIRHEENQGVGGAVMTGYLRAQAAGMDIAVKIDGDGQMDPSLMSFFVAPILSGRADYTKGNRFYSLKNIRQMPKTRIFGNAVLSFLTKFSTGYWDLFDPTNGYTAIHCGILARLDTDRLSKRYFFETDMLFRLNIIRAVVVDVPMDAKYGEEESNLKISKILFEFLGKHVRNFGKRIFYNYFLRDMSIASMELLSGVGLSFFGFIFSIYHWWDSLSLGRETPVGTIIVGMVSLITGLQLLLAFFAYDIANVPRHSIHKPIR
jgi:glycosyltransferase involved in cell wall biosynthesis